MNGLRLLLGQGSLSETEECVVEIRDSVLLQRLEDFFQSSGSERMQGLDAGYFRAMSPSEKEQAWNFLLDRFESSTDRIIGLHLLDGARSTALFKQAIALPLEDSPYRATRRHIAGNRLLLLSLVNDAEPDAIFVDAMVAFSDSECPDVRAAFARALPSTNVTPAAMAALQHMILHEADEMASMSAVQKLMRIHGLSSYPPDAVNRAIYQLLRSEDRADKVAGMQKLEALRSQEHP